MDVQQLLENARDTLTVQRVFGDPYERDGVTVIPVARVQGGGGGRAGQRPGRQRGWRRRVRPVRTARRRVRPRQREGPLGTRDRHQPHRGRRPDPRRDRAAHRPRAREVPPQGAAPHTGVTGPPPAGAVDEAHRNAQTPARSRARSIASSVASGSAGSSCTSASAGRGGVAQCSPGSALGTSSVAVPSRAAPTRRVAAALRIRGDQRARTGPG